MAVTNNVVRIATADSTSGEAYDDIGGGQGSTFESDVPIEGTDTRARRADNSNIGFSYDNGTGINLSASGTHVGFWSIALQWLLISTDISYYIGGGATPTTSPYSVFNYTAANYPARGGYIRVWIDLARTRDAGAGTLNTSSIRQFGSEFDMGNVGGNAKNIHQDAVDETDIGLLLTGGTSGSPETLASLETTDTANEIGIIGDGFLDGPVQLGGASTHIEQSNVVYTAGNQPLAASDWIRIDCLASSATSVIRLNSGFLKGVLLTFTGTSGEINLGSMIVSDVATAMTLTSAVEWAGTLSNSASLTAGGANLVGLRIVDSTAASSLIYNETADPDGFLDNMEFTSDGSNHAIEFGTSSPLTINLRGQKYTGYAGSNGSTGNETIWIRRTSGTVNINILDGGDTPTIRTDGATVVVANNKSFKFTVNPSVTGYEWRIYEVTAVGSLAGSVEVAGEESATADNQTYTYPSVASQPIAVQIIYNDGDYEESISYYTLTPESQDVTINLEKDINN